MTAPLLVLRCHACEWEPDGNLTMGIVRAHFQTEHGTDDAGLDLTPICPRDRTKLDTTRTTPLGPGRQAIEYLCPTCRRSYGITQKQEPTA